ncbi:hypothetical protein [Pseudarthrobacter sp. ATCC 49987]|uniref:hypothetical protein n=1 Tax=Pseudarthrobacter sp. ATCC 49987 TaxID=2698204 RepID=UPI001371FBC5|nr:hypothetical protein [Pseudarthrobacter sp. ATCC 49987]
MSLPAAPHLDDAAAFLGAKAQKDRDAAQLALAKLLAAVAGEYDLVLLDCPPGMSPRGLSRQLLPVTHWYR